MNKKSLLLLVSIILLSTTTCANFSKSSENYKKIASSVTTEKLSTSELEKIATKITVKVHVGQDRGSGILIGNQNNTYQVITNAHVVDRDNSYSIGTPDWIKHQATLINKDGREAGNDLAVLEFSSDNTYQVGKIAESSKLSLGDEVLAAGFPFDSQDIKLSGGNISLLLDKSLLGGYQIGFSNETIQGMSGGVLLNSQGEVIGILGKGKSAILNTAYLYQDGTIPPVEKVEIMKDASFSIPIAKAAELSPQIAELVPKQYF